MLSVQILLILYYLESKKLPIQITNTRSVKASPCGKFIFVGQTNSLTALIGQSDIGSHGDAAYTASDQWRDVNLEVSDTDVVCLSDREPHPPAFLVASIGTNGSILSFYVIINYHKPFNIVNIHWSPLITDWFASFCIGIVKIFAFYRELFYFVYQFAELPVRINSTRIICK